MPRRKTSRVRKKKTSSQLELRVNSPRIFGFSCLRCLGRAGKFAVLACVVVALGFGARMGLQKVFIENDEFQLQEIHLETNGLMTEECFAELTELDLSASVFAFRLSDARRKLEERPGILEADVGRRLPGTLKVTLIERTPVAWIECDGLGIVARDVEKGLLVDREGVVLPCEPWWVDAVAVLPVAAVAALPVVVVADGKVGDFMIGKKMRHREAERALHLVQLSSRMLSGADWNLPVVAVQNDYSLIAATSSGTVATFGMYEHQRQLGDLKAVLRHARETGRGVTRVNLIPERNIPVGFAGEHSGPTGGGPKKITPNRGNRLEQDIRSILNRS